MSSPVPTPPAPVPERRAARIREGRWLGGVCTGVAEHLRVPVLWVRVVFVVLAGANFLGALAYGMLWLLLPVHTDGPRAPGTIANSHGGLRLESPRRRSRTDLGVALAVVALGVGLVWLSGALGWGLDTALLFPIVFGCLGLALVWRQADNTVDADPVPRVWYAPLLARQGWFAVLRVSIGLGLVGAALGYVFVSQMGWTLLPQAMGLFLLALLGGGLVIAPWAYRARQQLNSAREAKLLADQRADMAAHLHDSVLQTLALIQRQADDPKAVAALARRQERELRTWLYGDVPADATLKAALTRAAQELEDERGVPVELVCVGDLPLDDDLTALVRAAREAIMNAAKHSGAPLIDVYAEAEPDLVTVFVRDRGRGFDPGSIDPDRQGVRRSIVERMERHGGRATIRSTPGAGTEVRLEMTR